MLSVEKYLDIRQRPAGKPLMFQRWSNLAFCHFAVDPTELQRHLPVGLTLDTFPDCQGNDMAWIGIVTFEMSGIQFVGAPKIPFHSDFPETNVRTYVHRDGEAPGVYFFSLDASNWIACKVARALYSLPYTHAEICVKQHENQMEYRLRRLEEPLAELDFQYEIGEPMPPPEVGTFDFWAVERYLLYSVHHGEINVGRVWHEPYPICHLHTPKLNSNLCESLDLPSKPPERFVFSPGVSVEVFALEQT